MEIFKRIPLKLKTGEKVHDFRNMGWGWALHDVYEKKDGTYYTVGHGQGIENKDFVRFTHNKTDKDVGYQLDNVEYKSNPKDMFTADIINGVEFEKGDFEGED